MFENGLRDHNGSVPTVYEVISPPEERSTVFWVGRTALDADKLGFQSGEPGTELERRGLFRFDTRLPGNRNIGHRYPKRPYNERQRWAVIEYLKDPERF